LYYFCAPKEIGVVAQLVEQRTENPCVTGSIPVDATAENVKWRNGENCFAILSSCQPLKGDCDCFPQLFLANKDAKV
jgi:hypothetical protein